jgi:hypothetical protein
MRALRGDFIGVPFPGGFRHRIDLGDAHDRAGAVARIRPLVEDIDFVADLGIDLVRLIATEEDAAVGFFVGPELRSDLEVVEGGLADEVGGILTLQQLVGDDRAIFHRPIGFADLVPITHPGAVEQRDPSAFALAGGTAGKLESGGCNQQADRECR